MSIIDKFLSGLKQDIQTRDITIESGLKWIAILFLTYYLYPFVALFFVWVIWKKTEWNKSKKWIATIVTLLLTLWVASISVEPSQRQVTDVQKQTAKETQPSQASQQVEEKTEAVAITPEIKQGSELYQVISVVDGDTIKVDINGSTETLRLIGMDTPETVDPRKVVQCFGEEASKKAKETLTGKKVRLEADPTQGELDKYQRLLRYVFLEDGTLYNKWMIQEGYAHEYTYQNNPYKYQTDFKEAERTAREGKKGLWSDDTCKGDTLQPAATAAGTLIVGSALVDDSSTAPSTTPSAPVKKSKTGICHAPGTTYYAKTTNFTPFVTVNECLNNGGRLPKR